MSDISQPRAEFSRIVDANRIGAQEVVREIAANEAERQALAGRFGLVSLDRLTATVHLHRPAGPVLQAKGSFEADLAQPCVVTLEPVPAHIARDFSVRFEADFEVDRESRQGEVVISPTGEDPPEPMIDGKVDIGEMVAEQLSISLDPYPRAPGCEVPPAYGDAAEEAGQGGRVRPFADLARLLDKG